MILTHHGINSFSDKVLIGDKQYKFVQIGDQTWLAENLALKTTNSVAREGHPDFGLYYPYTDIDEIETLVDGWHVPTAEELRKLLISDIPANTYRIQSTNYKNVWPDATNSSDFSAVPNSHINDTTLDRSLLWFHAGYIGIQVNSVPFMGSIPSLSFCVRLIKDTEPVEIGGRKYKTVRIGNQLWMMENLDYQFEGLNIGGATLQSDVHAWYYNNDPAQSEGLLYNGYAAKYLADHPELLPKGWKVPESSDFGILQNAVGGANIAGNRLKNPVTMNGINSYRFNGLATGMVSSNGAFTDRNTYLRLWTPNMSQSDETAQQFLTLKSDQDAATVASFAKDQTVAYSIRLVKNLSESDSKGLLSTVVEDGKEDIDEKPVEEEKKTEEIVVEKEIIKEDETTENKR